MSRISIISRTRFRAIGRCIYCGDATDRLTTEHIVPFGLGGQWELPASSCEVCRKITHQFETECMRKTFFRFRVRSGFPSRKRKEWPKTFPAEILSHDGVRKITQIPAAELPRLLVLSTFPVAGILRGRDPSEPVQQLPWASIPWRDLIKMVGQFHSGSFDTSSFCRMLAKIGHSSVYASLTDESLSKLKLLLPDFIRTGSGSPFHLIGTDAKIPVPASEKPCHSIDLVLSSYGSRQYLVAMIRLFAHLGAPVYHAVVGELPKPGEPLELDLGAQTAIRRISDKNRADAH